ncbi:type I restriction-modification system subunit M [Caloramator australicus]|uniref:site-specific DNA-methyltransferase (adenine-specific) n=1 Tax=Caloramator australicus RC3 TaxID=857293 RepID=I7LI96_9CLOT|nr:class I SAM-dependent DNA methyltransferase [Caloramator australicus]CCJ32772.1 Type I restriction-modification system,DNA-methyltransferase subunit M [Caloramator australicus RC3]
MYNFQEKVDFIWSIAEILRGPYRKEEYRNVILPMCILRRFDCVLENTKEIVLQEYQKIKNLPQEAIDEILNRKSGCNFSNISKFDFNKLLADPDNIADNLKDYINGFSKNARDIIEHFEFHREIDKMDKNNLLYLVVKRFSEIDLHPDVVSNSEMGLIFEELIRRFLEDAEAGDHYTPREVIKLMVNLLFLEDDDILTKPGITQTIYDPCAGTGGMGLVAQDYLKELNPSAKLEFFAQEINPQSYAICKADMLIKGQNANNIKLGNTLSQDAFPDKKFDYMITNPPYGVEWKPAEEAVKKEYEEKGFDGRFGAGLPRISDGQLLFVQHLVSKMKPVTNENPKGSRIAIIMNGSPLFTGDAGSGESDIRKWLIENDLVEGIVALPTELFYNTGIATYIWILTNNKSSKRKGKIQLVNAVDFYEKMKKSLGNKRNYITEKQIEEIVRIYGDFKESEYCKIFDNEDFGYRKIVIERPLRLNFKIDDERIKNLYEETAFKNLATSKKKGEAAIKEIEEGKKLQDAIIAALNSIKSDKVYKNREEFTKVLKDLFKKNQLNVSSNLLKAILSALSEKDETADACIDSKGNIEPDPDLRDTENVPLKEDIYEYFEREVKPHVHDAWIDEDKTKIGYEIPFTRHFYKYTPLRSSEEIRNEIIELEKIIQEKLKKVMEI